jgi:hypothetical protein
MATDAATADRLRPDRPRLLPGLAVLVAAAALAVGGDVLELLAGEGQTAVLETPTGPVVAGLVVVVWLVAGTPHTFVAGQVGLVVALEGGPRATPLAQAALLGVLVVDVAASHRGTDRLRTALVAGVAAVVLLGIRETVASTVGAAGTILAVAALATYTIHRYERLTLGLVGDAE